MRELAQLTTATDRLTDRLTDSEELIRIIRLVLIDRLPCGLESLRQLDRRVPGAAAACPSDRPGRRGPGPPAGRTDGRK